MEECELCGCVMFCQEILLISIHGGFGVLVQRTFMGMCVVGAGYFLRHGAKVWIDVGLCDRDTNKIGSDEWPITSHRSGYWFSTMPFVPRRFDRDVRVTMRMMRTGATAKGQREVGALPNGQHFDLT